MKLISGLILIFLLMVQPLSKTWIYVSFKINQAYIAKNLCVQKEIEGNSCKGCCQLKKEFKKADDEEQKTLPKGINLKTEIVYYSHPTTISCSNQILLFKNISYSSFDQHFINSSLITDIFHPPQLNL
ncbi:MAG: hypothetical protein ACOYN5_02565 [Bacteroidales bacterium]